jgi:hypothetical protein
MGWHADVSPHPVRRRYQKNPITDAVWAGTTNSVGAVAQENSDARHILVERRQRPKPSSSRSGIDFEDIAKKQSKTQAPAPMAGVHRLGRCRQL